MAQSKILLDTNSYLRLAKDINPLLFHEFCDARYCLYIFDEFEKEYEKSQRLKTRFAWVNEAEYKNNRGKRLNVSKKDKADIEITKSVIMPYADDSGYALSLVDITVLSCGSVLNIPVVTDDSAMIMVANDLGITYYTTLQLMKIMIDCGHIDMGDVRRITQYWRHVDDLPKNFPTDYKSLFGEPPPRKKH